MDRKRIRRTVLQLAESGSLESWWWTHHKDTAPYNKRTSGSMLREFYFGLASELVALRGSLAEGISGDDLGMAEMSQRLTELEEVFEDEESKSDGMTGDAWIDEQLAGLENELQPEVKEYDFAGRHDDQDRR